MDARRHLGGGARAASRSACSQRISTPGSRPLRAIAWAERMSSRSRCRVRSGSSGFAGTTSGRSVPRVEAAAGTAQPPEVRRQPRARGATPAAQDGLGAAEAESRPVTADPRPLPRLHLRDLRRRREQPRRVRGGARGRRARQAQRCNPLFVYGGTGLGKTHLLKATANAVAGERWSRRASRYLTAEAFVNEMIAALRRHQMERFRQRFRGIGTLIVDDIQFLGDKKRSQQEFTHTFNALHDGRKQIVIASDRAPHELPGFEETLRSRFACRAAGRHRAARRRAAPGAGRTQGGGRGADARRRGRRRISRSTGAATAGRSRASCGGSRRSGSWRGEAVTLALVRDALAPFRPSSDGRKSVGRIVGEVCRHYQVTRDELVSPPGPRA